jgi:hypothetical protein
MKIICSGIFAQTNVGHIDNLMAYVLGFERLGHQVYVMEDVDSKRCFDSKQNQVAFDHWAGRSHFESLAKSYGVWPRSSLIYNGGEATHGLSFNDAIQVAKESDLLLVVGGRFHTPEILQNVGLRAYVDINPAKTQVYYSEYKVNYGFEKLDHYFTVGLNIGSPDCEIPTGGLKWKSIIPPVFLPLWPAKIDESSKRFTTISSWAGRHTFRLNGKFSGEKSEQWKEFISIPKQTNQEIELALTISERYAEDIALFRQNGWILSDPKRFQTPEEYRAFITSSRAEFSVANYRYVQFNTGWISDRSARYLASGKPVLVQSTGVEKFLPAGKGLVTFSTVKEAIAGIEALNHDYVSHCQAARKIAEEFVDSDQVLSKLLTQVGLQ